MSWPKSKSATTPTFDTMAMKPRRELSQWHKGRIKGWSVVMMDTDIGLKLWVPQQTVLNFLRYSKNQHSARKLLLYVRKLILWLSVLISGSTSSRHVQTSVWLSVAWQMSISCLVSDFSLSTSHLSLCKGGVVDLGVCGERERWSDARASAELLKSMESMSTRPKSSIACDCLIRQP